MNSTELMNSELVSNPLNFHWVLLALVFGAKRFCPRLSSFSDNLSVFDDTLSLVLDHLTDTMLARLSIHSERFDRDHTLDENANEGIGGIRVVNLVKRKTSPVIVRKSIKDCQSDILDYHMTLASRSSWLRCVDVRSWFYATLLMWEILAVSVLFFADLVSYAKIADTVVISSFVISFVLILSLVVVFAVIERQVRRLQRIRGQYHIESLNSRKCFSLIQFKV